MKIILTNTLGNEFVLSNQLPIIINSFVDESVDVNIHSSKGMNQDGYSCSGCNLDKRQITIKYTIKTDSVRYTRSIQSEINRVINPKLGELTLTHITDDQQEYTIKAICEKIPSKEKINKKIHSFNLIFICLNPFWKSKQMRTEIAKWKQYFHFPVTFVESGDIIGYREQSLIANVYNEGEVESPMLVEFIARGDVVKPKILNVTTGEYILIKNSMVAGERILVNTEFNKKKVTRIFNKEESNAFHFIDLNSTFFHLDIGDNLIKYDAESGLDNLEVNIYHTPLYLGV